MLEMELLDLVTQQPILDKNGNPTVEHVPEELNASKLLDDVYS